MYRVGLAFRRQENNIKIRVSVLMTLHRSAKKVRRMVSKLVVQEYP
jgi:hypothetical protein